MTGRRNLTRREFLKRGAAAGVAALGGATLIGGGAVAVGRSLRALELARRDERRARGGSRWMVEEERRLMGALAELIVPAGEDGPGARQAGVLESIERALAGEPEARRRYADGLLAFDELALERYGRPFAELAAELQKEIIRGVEDARAALLTAAPSLPSRARRKAAELYHTWPQTSARAAAALWFPQAVGDVLQAFYTSPVAWGWLGYAGPPFPRAAAARARCGGKGVAVRGS